MFKRCVDVKTEDRMYAFWVAYATNPFGGKKRMSWEEFKAGGKKESSDANPNSNYKGVDLVKRMKNKG